MNENVLYFLTVILAINKSKYITDKDKAVKAFVTRWITQRWQHEC